MIRGGGVLQDSYGAKRSKRSANSIGSAIGFRCVKNFTLLELEKIEEFLSKPKLLGKNLSSKEDLRKDGFLNSRKEMWDDFKQSKDNLVLQFVILRTIIQRFPEESNKAEKYLSEIQVTPFTKQKLVGATFFNNKYYGAFQTRISWLQANDICEKTKGRMLIIQDEKTQKFIGEYINSLRWERCWLGLRHKNNQWFWVTNQSLKYSNWMKGEPNNTNGLENYAELVNGDAWNDNIDQLPYPFICEWSVKK